ncbi:MAG TPA: hypothetical protein VGC27_01880, partial [Rhizomicrobium sp.]
MREGRNIVRRAGLWSLAIAACVAVLLGALLYTPAGLAWSGRLVRPLSDGTVTVIGLGGVFPNALHADAVEIADTEGVWLRLEQVTLHWSALPALNNHIVVQSVIAANIRVLRRPLPSETSQGKTPRIDIEHFSAPHIEIAAPLLGRSAVLAAEGTLHYQSRHQLAADIAVTRTGGNDSYRVHGGIEQDVARGQVTIREGADGILGGLLGLPGLGPVNLTAQASGGATANAVAVSLSAGALSASGRGTLRLAERSADVDFSASAPAMRPAADIAWQSLSADGHFHGNFDAPLIEAHVVVDGAESAGLGVKQLTLDLAGQGGGIDLRARAAGLTLPGAPPDLFAHAPVALQAHAELTAAARPVRFTISHPLADLRGQAQTRDDVTASAVLTVPSIAPFAALQNIDADGSATFRIALMQSGPRTKLALDARMDTQGKALVARLLGRGATLALNATVTGGDITDSTLELHGAAIEGKISGSLRKRVLDYRLALRLPDVSRLSGALHGTLSLQGGATGPIETAAVSIGGNADLARKGFARQRVTVNWQSAGLPMPSNARLSVSGRFDNAPLAVNAVLGGVLERTAHLTARWKSLDANADFALSEGGAATGKGGITLKRLADFAAFTGSDLAGSANAELRFE